MFCWSDEEKQCVAETEQRAFDGTTCGNIKWCRRGHCVYDPAAPPARGLLLCILLGIHGIHDIRDIQDIQSAHAHLPERPEICYSLRERSHNKTLLTKTAYLSDQDYLTRMLHKNSC